MSCAADDASGATAPWFRLLSVSKDSLLLSDQQKLQDSLLSQAR